MKVTAIESVNEGVMRSYGEGEYLGDKIPDVEPFKSLKMKNPCIKLDSGKHIWGFQCWWGETEKVNAKYEGKLTGTVIVEVEEEILPVEDQEGV